MKKFSINQNNCFKLNKKCDLEKKSLFEVLNSNVELFLTKIGFDVYELNENAYSKVVGLFKAKDAVIETNIEQTEVTIYSKSLGLEFTFNQEMFRLLYEHKDYENNIKTVNSYQVKFASDEITELAYNIKAIMKDLKEITFFTPVEQVEIRIVVNGKTYNGILENSITHQELDRMCNCLIYFNYVNALRLLQERSMNNSTNR